MRRPGASILKSQLPVSRVLEVPVGERLHPTREPRSLQDVRRERGIRHVEWSIADRIGDTVVACVEVTIWCPFNAQLLQAVAERIYYVS